LLQVNFIIAQVPGNVFAIYREESEVDRQAKKVLKGSGIGITIIGKDINLNNIFVNLISAS
jgi:hypothetical protein